jgi:hypothetical protein
MVRRLSLSGQGHVSSPSGDIRRMHICSALQMATHLPPALYGFEELPGDWCMVVMEDIDPYIYRPYNGLTFSEQQRQHIRHESLRCIRTLHNAEMVHGDICDTNLLVRFQVSRKWWRTPNISRWACQMPTSTWSFDSSSIHSGSILHNHPTKCYSFSFICT